MERREIGKVREKERKREQRERGEKETIERQIKETGGIEIEKREGE